jgi:D-alanine-D-alanine ligase
MRPALEGVRYDSIVLVEERLTGTELTVGVIGNRDLQALPVVEIVSKREFFDYRANTTPASRRRSCPRASPTRWHAPPRTHAARTVRWAAATCRAWT